MLASQPFDFFFVSSSLCFFFYAFKFPLKSDGHPLSAVGVFFAEILYNSNSSNSNSKVDTIRIMHNSNNSIGNKGNINRIVRTSSKSSINAIMRITSD